MMPFIFIQFLTMGFSQSNWEPVMKARSMAALVTADIELSREHESNKRCLLEKQNDWFPENCFFLLDQATLEPQKFKNLDGLNQDFTKSCVKNASKLESVQKIKSFLEKLNLSKDCQKALQRQKLDIEYRAGTYFENKQGL